MFEIKFTVEGDKALSKMLQEAGVKVRDMRQPLSLAAEEYLKRVKQNFKTSGKTFGEPWKPLSPATIAIKRRLYKQGYSRAIERPLVRKGFLRNSFDYDFKTKTRVEFFSSVDYANVHQEGARTKFRGHFVTIPRRVLMKLDNTSQEMILKTLMNWLETVLK